MSAPVMVRAHPILEPFARYGTKVLGPPWPDLLAGAGVRASGAGPRRSR